MIEALLLNRRRFLQTGAAATTGLLSAWSRQNLWAAGSLPSDRHFEVRQVQRTTVKLPYRETPQRNMDRELPHWRWVEICEVTLESGVTGVGETLLYYTWGATGDDDVARATGRNGLDLMWDDSLGAGLQMALFDAVAKTAHVPIHALLGKQVNQTTPLSWWNIDTSAADMEAECREALRLGYRSYKTKGRPWFDIWRQVEQACGAVPESFKIDMDFNDTLLTAAQGLPILMDLEKHKQVDIYETPIPQSDVAGNRQIREATRVNVALHFGTPKPEAAIREQVCDGFVIGGGATAVMRAGSFSALADKSFWLQLVGSGLTAAYSLHFGGVLSHAVWPAVNCHQLYRDDLLVEPIQLEGGRTRVPSAPGLGYELNRDAVERYRVVKPAARPDPPRLIRTTWPSGKTMYTANDGSVNFMLRAGQQGKYPYYERGADTALAPDDGTPAWRELYERARRDGPVVA